MLDRNFPPTPKQVKLTVGSLLAAAIIGGALFGGLIPGLRPNFSPPEFQTFEGRSYYWVEVLVPIVFPGTNVSSVENASVHGAVFEYWIMNQLGGRYTYLQGSATVANGTTYSFLVGGSLAPAERTTQYVSSDQEIVVLWTGGLTAEFLFLAS
jgi:hypothetical protein